ncbi:hypothetical protein EB061_09735 [bacterium]|nr:hypothetical protein [bacterium]
MGQLLRLAGSFRIPFQSLFSKPVRASPISLCRERSATPEPGTLPWLGVRAHLEALVQLDFQQQVLRFMYRVVERL